MSTRRIFLLAFSSMTLSIQASHIYHASFIIKNTSSKDITLRYKKCGTHPDLDDTSFTYYRCSQGDTCTINWESPDPFTVEFSKLRHGSTPCFLGSKRLHGFSLSPDLKQIEGYNTEISLEAKESYFLKRCHLKLKGAHSIQATSPQ